MAKKPAPASAQNTAKTSEKTGNSAGNNAATKTAAHGENFPIYIGVAIFFITFGLLLAGGYFYQQQKQSGKAQAAFSPLTTMRFQMQDFTLRANMTLELGDPEWLAQNKSKVQFFMESALRDAPPAELNANNPDKISQLQDKLTQAVKKKFPDGNINQVLITEFLTSRDTQ